MPQITSEIQALTSQENVTLYLTSCIVDNACRFCENSSVCRIHRVPAYNTYKILPLGRWIRIGTLEQEYNPLPYLKLTGHFDYLGYKLLPTVSLPEEKMLKKRSRR